MPTCIPKENIDKFKKALKNGGELDIRKLLDPKMTSDARTTLFEKFAGDNAKDLNLLFEKKLILKRKLKGIENWIDKSGETGRYDPAKKAKLNELKREYVAKQEERMLNPKEDQSFLADLVEENLGVRISKEQGKIAWDIKMKSDKAFENYDLENKTWKSAEAKAEYGATEKIYKKYIDNLKTGNLPIKGMLKGYSKEIKDLWKEDKFGATKKIMGDSASTLIKTMINAKASWDNSFLGRQGALTLIKSPKTWWRMAKSSFGDMWAETIHKTGDIRQDALFGEVYSHPDYIDGTFKKADLDFGIEEEVATQLLERVPVVGRLFKASDLSFTDSAIRARMGLWDIMKQVDKAKGIELTEAEIRDRGKIINSITARGKVGRIGGSVLVRLLMWAPRMLKADWDVLTAHTFGFGLETGKARVQAVGNLTKLVIVTAGITAIAEAMGAEVEKDTRSTDFLRIKIGNTRINTPFGRGMPQLVTLFSRLLTQSTKSSTGVIKQLNDGTYGSKTLFDVGLDFLSNKVTPPVGVALSILKGKNFAGEKPTVGGVAFETLPISVQNFIGLKDEATSASVFGAFADLVGIGSNTYSNTETDWGESTGKELLQFKEKVGETKFKESNDKFNKDYETWLTKAKVNPKYTELSDEDKQKVITKSKASIKDRVFRQYRFKYKTVKSKPLPKI